MVKNVFLAVILVFVVGLGEAVAENSLSEISEITVYRSDGFRGHSVIFHIFINGERHETPIYPKESVTYTVAKGTRVDVDFATSTLRKGLGVITIGSADNLNPIRDGIVIEHSRDVHLVEITSRKPWMRLIR